MKTALGVYAAVYTVAAIVTIWDDPRSGHSAWDTAMDIVLMPLGLIGLLLFLNGVSNPEVKWLWKFAAPIVVAGLIVNSLRGRYRTKKKLGAQYRGAALFSDVVTTMLLVPMFIVNLVFAFS